MKPRFSLICFTFILLSGLSLAVSAQTHRNKEKGSKINTLKVKNNWLVVVTDTVAGLTKEIPVKQNSKMKVVISSYSPEKRLVKRNKIVTNKISANRPETQSESKPKSTLNFSKVLLPTAHRILVNPRVRSLVPKPR